jgi:hypothetical protein
MYQEARGFITDTNNRCSINTGPFPNSALLYIERLALLRRAKENRSPSEFGFR